MDDMHALRNFRGDVPPASGASRSAARLALESRFDATPDTPPQRNSWTAPRRLVPLTVAAAIAVVMMVAGPLLNSGAPASNAAAAELNAVAEVASKQAPDTSLRGMLQGEFLYTRSESLSATLSVNADGGSFAGALVPITREMWMAADGSGRIRQTTGEPIPLGDADPDLVAQIGGSMNLDQTFLTGELYNSLDQLGVADEDLSRLAADPAALLELLQSIAETRGKALDAQSLNDPVSGTADVASRELDYRTFTLIGDLLRESVAPPDFRAALYRKLAGLSSIELLGDVTDAAGRAGVAVAMTHAGTRHEVIFDPATSALLGERDVLTEASPEWGGAAAGTVVGQITYLESGVVDSTEATP